MKKLKFGICKNCKHQLAMKDSLWLHHITRSRLLHFPHWPSGHVITVDCKWQCECKVPELDQTKPVKSKLTYLGRNTDK